METMSTYDRDWGGEDILCEHCHKPTETGDDLCDKCVEQYVEWVDNADQ